MPYRLTAFTVTCVLIIRAAFFGVSMFCSYKLILGKVFKLLGLFVYNINIHGRIQVTVSMSLLVHVTCTILCV